VAIKVLPAAFVEDRERLQRFEREAPGRHQPPTLTPPRRPGLRECATCSTMRECGRREFGKCGRTSPPCCAKCARGGRS
jgi:hypothetical protein